MTEEATMNRLGEIVAKLYELPEAIDRLRSFGAPHLPQHTDAVLVELTNAIERFKYAGVMPAKYIDIAGHDGHCNVYAAGSMVAHGIGRDGADGIFYALTGQREA